MKVVTSVVNNVDFIEMQFYTLKRHFKGDYEFIVFNDAKGFPDFTNDGDVSIKSQIELRCETLGIKCINIPNENHKQNHCSASRCADSMNYILNYQLKNPDKYLLIDSDMFLISDFNIEKYSEYDCAIVLQSRNNFNTNYFWNGIYYFDIHKMKDKELLNWNCCKDCDVGGMMQDWLKKQIFDKPIPNTDEIRWSNNKLFHTEKIYFIKHLWSCSWDKTEYPFIEQPLLDFLEKDIRNVNNKYFCEIYDDVFLHYRAGGNWRREGMNIHKTLTQKLKNILIN